ncbi:hypothetical protein ACQP1K_13655 [Sphaerimonospora sp. CA-214678]|uniref:hypothetical protein n=1 Tax=Sphaerimonospora sp. CA-214678 TaxID=3240029 RepID=UPI003D949575
MRRLKALLVRSFLAIAMIVAGLGAGATGAQAAVPNLWGFALVDTTSGVPSTAHQAGSWPPGFTVQVSPGVIGQVFVKFPQIGVPKGAVVHVTAVSPAAEWCQIQKWAQSGPDEIVAVQCYKYGGGPVWARFSIVFSHSTGTLPPPQAFGYVFWDGAAILSHHNSAGAVNTVTPTGPGEWLVDMPGLGSSGYAGNIQVTAVDPQQPARCKVAKWGPSPSMQQIVVRCHDKYDKPLKTGWTLTYHRDRAVTGAAIPPKSFAYTFDNQPSLPGPYAPAPAPVNYNSLGAVNTIQSAGPGLRLVIFPKVGVLPNHVQVTAYGPGPEYCNLLAPWGTGGGDAIVRDVACYKGTVLVDQPSLVTYLSAY